VLTLPPSVLRQLPRVLSPLGRHPVTRRAVSRLFIGVAAGATPPRPRALTLFADYPCWTSLTDRRWTGRHLPPSTAPADALPAEADVVALFRREREVPSTETSAMFMFFAQWFTDSFLRTSRSDWRQNTSTQEIDLCQLYGLSADKTRMLREGRGGRLKSQLVDGEEYPPFLFEAREPGGELKVKPEFRGLHDEHFITDVILGGVPDERKDAFFAVGLEHGNGTLGTTAMNVVMLREHNRIAALLAAAHPEWQDPDDPDAFDDRVFETTRSIMIVLLLKIVVEEYIRHIVPHDFPLEMVPFAADGAPWNRSNWVAVEFNLLYRWHMLAPEHLGHGPDRLPHWEFRDNNALLLERGVEWVMRACSTTRAGRIGLGNTPTWLTDRSHPERPSVEERSVALSRRARLASYNDYREQFGLKRITSFEALTGGDASLAARLRELYGSVDRLEWYVGIWAEAYPDYAMMGDLLMTMVAHDAFTQALTNPLLARAVYGPQTFTEEGMRIIESTRSLQDIALRTSRRPGEVQVGFRW
jgi:prostaglandin-endoperoxide synthase 2